MSDILTLLQTLQRPRILIRAARFGLAEYRRDRDLARIVQSTEPASPEMALAALMDVESEIEDIRRAGDVTYSAGRHIEILIAMMAEARLIPPPGPKLV